MTTMVWPPPCRSCGKDIKQQTEWNKDATLFRQRCHVCSFESDWEPYVPVRVGYGLDQLAKAAVVRRQHLEKALVSLKSARAFSLAYVPLRDRIDSIITDLDDCLRGLR